jgi:type II secretion system protein I
MKKQRGFSLIEVLIALAILAIALTAALMLATRSTQHIQRTQNQVMALWVAQNTLAQIKMGLIRLQDDRPVSGSQQELQQTFFYQARTSVKYTNADEINIQVGLEENKPIVTLKGWHWHTRSGATS